jgi:periplasmic protein TonB
MKTKNVESLEDLIFENRNKLYGAYSLRKKYGSQLIISLFVAVLFVGSALTYPLMMERDNKVIPKHDSVKVDETPFKKHDTEPLKPVQPPPSVPQPKKTDIAFKVPVVTNDSVLTTFGKQDLLALNNTVPKTEASGSEPGDSEPPKPEPVIPDPVKAEPQTWVPEMPHFPGGEKEMAKFLLSQLKFPPTAREVGIQGVVYLNFVVESDGSLTNIYVYHDIGGGCAEEAIRVVKSMPNWVPGRQNGIPVRVRMTLPVKFTLH